MHKKHSGRQLEKFSTIFQQLGLVLSLFIIYVLVEYKAEKVENNSMTYNKSDSSEKYTPIDQSFVFVKDVPKKLKPKIKRKPIMDLNQMEKITNDKEITDLLVDDKKSLVDVSKIKEIIEDDIDEKDDPVLMITVQNAPVFKGCEGLNEKEVRVCFEKKMKQYVRRYFDNNLGNVLGMRAGKYGIYTRFVIDKQGNISDVKIRAPHVRFEKEVNKIIDKIPQFIPGKQNNKPVKVIYNLPIIFMIE